MKKLLLDVEVSPNLATIWGIWNQNIGINQLHETSRILCFTAKWHKDEKVIFDSEFNTNHFSMMENLHELMNSADAIIHYNGNKFDIPVINREFLRYSMEPPAPYKNIDLLAVVKRKFRFVSNKLDHVVQELGIGKKAETGGHQLWLDCMAGKPEAWAKMEAYNRQDVAILEGLYDRLIPWIDDHPSHALYTDSSEVICTNCGSTHVHSRGTAYTKSRTYKRYQCTKCGTWMRGRYTTTPTVQSKNLLTQAV